MKRYTKLFFDFDDTLIDFKAAEKAALPIVFERFNLPFTTEVEAYYRHLNTSLWQQLEKGVISREQLLKQRFGQTMAHFGIQVDGREMDEQFRALLAETIVLIDGAKELLKTLSSNYEIYIVTNGVLATQKQRLALSGLESYISRMFVSEETGYQKPQIEFFNYVFERLHDVQIEECLIIGDSYSADMIGGMNVNMDTCWYNPQKKPIPSILIPTYEIQKLDELLSVLQKNNG